MMRRKKGNSVSGFTLIELIIVMTIIGLIAFLTPALFSGTVDRIKINSTAKYISVALRYARSTAIAENIPLVFSFDREKGEYWLSSALIKKESDQAHKLKLNRKKAIPSELTLLVEEYIDSKYELPAYFFLDFEDKDRNDDQDNDEDPVDEDADNEAIFPITFFPDGTSSGGKITINQRNEETFEHDGSVSASYEIIVDLFTGDITLKDLSLDLLEE